MFAQEGDRFVTKRVFERVLTLQGAAITPVHKIYGQVVGVATEERTHSMYMDYLSGQLTGEYTPEQYFDLYLYDNLLGFHNLPETAVFTQISLLVNCL